MASHENETPADQATKIKFRFCRNCANLLYPGEDRADGGGLIFECRHCNESERAENSCVFRNELSNTVGETAGITQDVGSDPTLPRTNKQCPACESPHAVFFQSQQRTAETGMKLYFVCCDCGHVWQ